MNSAELEQIRKEIATAFVGRRFGVVFPLSRTSLAIDFHPHNSVYLFIDFDSKVRKAYLIRRRLKELQRSSVHSSPFVIQMRKLLAGRELTSVAVDSDRTLILELAGGEDDSRKLLFVVQLGGAASNLFIVDDLGTIIHTARETALDGQRRGEAYQSPSSADNFVERDALRDPNGRSLSEILDEEERESNKDSRFASLAAAARRKIAAEIGKLRKLLKNLEGDLAGHGDADAWKRFGDLILANIANLRRDGDAITVTDYFDPEMAEVTIPADRNLSPSEAAEGYFKRYTKARNAAAAIVGRVASVNLEIAKLEEQQKKLETAIEAGDEQTVGDFSPERKIDPVGKKKEAVNEFKGARKFLSSDGYEILVGKKARDNDHLTFRVAKSLDLWLHAADYPGSHVVVRNPNRKEIPPRTLIEAAQLAAFYSDAREKPKTAVNYTAKKFVNKPKRAAPGLVSLASFKTILVEPKVVPRSESQVKK